MNSLKNLFSLVGIVLFGAIAVMEAFVKKSGFTSAGFIVAAVMLVLMVVCRFILVTKYNEENRETMQNASEALKKVSLPLGFLGGITLPLSAIFAVCVIIPIIQNFVTLPAIVGTIVSAVTYVLVALIPLTFAMGLLNGKYGGGTDFMVYSVALMLYIASGYFLNASINPFACAQLLLSLSLWDMVSGLMRKSAPEAKAPKEKKPKVKKDKKSEVEKKNEEVVAEVAAKAETASETPSAE